VNKEHLRRLAAEVRAELGLRPEQAFDPHLWSHEWGVPMLSLADVTEDPEALHRLTVEAPELWSAALISVGTGHAVIYNHAHAPARVLSDLTHEIAHLVAEHRIDSAWMQPGGKKCGASPEHEKEAAELGGALLIPAEEARVHAIAGRSEWALAERYRVSVEMATWRMRASGGTVIRRRMLDKRRPA
jgi:hypothetical protein